MGSQRVRHDWATEQQSEINNILLSQNSRASFFINLLQYNKLNYSIYYKIEFLYLLLLINVLIAQSCPILCDPEVQPTRICCLWNFPGKNTGEGCHFLIFILNPTSEIWSVLGIHWVWLLFWNSLGMWHTKNYLEMTKVLQIMNIRQK